MIGKIIRRIKNRKIIKELKNTNLSELTGDELLSYEKKLLSVTENDFKSIKRLAMGKI